MDAAPLPSCSDEDLLTRFRKGEKEAFGVLLRRYERELYGYLHRYLGNSVLAEDVFQNTFLQVYLKSGQYEAGRPVRPWLYTIATHQAIDALRRNGRHQAVSLERVRDESSGQEVKGLIEMLQSSEPGPLEQLVGRGTPATGPCQCRSAPGRLPASGGAGLLPGNEIPRHR